MNTTQPAAPPNPGVDAPHHLLLPMTSVATAETSGALVIAAAEGLRLTSAEGRTYLDAFCGLMNVNVGYGRQELVEAAAQTMSRLSYATNFFGRTSPEALVLASKLAEITPEGIDHFFYTHGGSEAIDSAVKLVRHANIISGRPSKMVVIARHNSYHGMTLASTTVTGQGPMREHIGPLLPGVVHISQPDAHSGDRAARELEAAIANVGPENVAAFVAEPIPLPVGVGVPPDDYWPAIQDVCERRDVRLIVDEVVTGFGRTGAMFACEHWGVRPDAIALSKGITSGYVPLGALGIGQRLYDELAASETILPNGFTSGGTPLGCAVALANLELIEREGLVDNAAKMGEYVREKLRDLEARHTSVVAWRSKGLLAAFDVDAAQLIADDRPGGVAVTEWLRENGVIVRPYGNSIAFGVALTVTRADLDELFDAFDRALHALSLTAAG